MDDLLKFHCNFGASTACTITLDLAEYRRDPMNIRPKTKWVGERKPETFEVYRAWIHTVNGRISEAIQRNHTYILQHWAEPPHWEFWVYYPSGDKKLVAEQDGVFDPAWMHR